MRGYPNTSSQIPRTCQRCGTTFQAWPYNIRRGGGKFCSVRCREGGYASQEERFWAQVRKTPGCWLWQGARLKSGYGHCYFDGKVQKAHRIAYKLTKGPIPPGIMVLHNCPDGDNPSCVCPEHLFLGTALDNARDRDAKGRTASGDRSAARLYPGMNAGTHNGRAKLTDADVLTMRARYDQGGITPAALARLYGVDHSVATKVVRRLSWKHLP